MMIHASIEGSQIVGERIYIRRKGVPYTRRHREVQVGKFGCAKIVCLHGSCLRVVRCRKGAVFSVIRLRRRLKTSTT